MEQTTRLVDIQKLQEDLAELLYTKESPSVILTDAGVEIYNSAIIAAMRVVRNAPGITGATPVYSQWLLRVVPIGQKVTFDGWMNCPVCKKGFRRIVGTQLFKRCPECGAYMTTSQNKNDV